MCAITGRSQDIKNALESQYNALINMLSIISSFLNEHNLFIEDSVQKQ